MKKQDFLNFLSELSKINFHLLTTRHYAGKIIQIAQECLPIHQAKERIDSNKKLSSNHITEILNIDGKHISNHEIIINNKVQIKLSFEWAVNIDRL